MGLKCNLLEWSPVSISVVVKQKFPVTAGRIIKMFRVHTS